jgi:hypothetical protein
MVNEGWSFAELMALPAREFSFWLQSQTEYSERVAEAARSKK